MEINRLWYGCKVSCETNYEYSRLNERGTNLTVWSKLVLDSMQRHTMTSNSLIDQKMNSLSDTSSDLSAAAIFSYIGSF
jgi:hypothetical protein